MKTQPNEEQTQTSCLLQAGLYMEEIIEIDTLYGGLQWTQTRQAKNAYVAEENKQYLIIA